MLTVFNLTALHPPGTTGGGAKALRECRAPPRGALVCRVQTRPELAEEDRRDLSAGSQQDQEHILRLWESWTENTRRTLAVTCRGAAMDMLVLYQDLNISHTHTVIVFPVVTVL